MIRIFDTKKYHISSIMILFSRSIIISRPINDTFGMYQHQ